MLGHIINSVYRGLCRQYLIAMRRNTAGRRIDPMTNPVNIAIYAFGGFMLFALAIGFFATPV
jgi:hypothetical protein